MKPGTKFEGCSERVAEALGPDVMKSVKDLIPDLLAALPVLLYQGVSAWLICDIHLAFRCSNHEIVLPARALQLSLGHHEYTWTDI